MRVFACINFKGHWPVGSAAVIVAEDETRAMTLLLEQLRKQGLGDQDDSVGVDEILLTSESVNVLCDGDY